MRKTRKRVRGGTVVTNSLEKEYTVNTSNGKITYKNSNGNPVYTVNISNGKKVYRDGHGKKIAPVLFTEKVPTQPQFKINNGVKSTQLEPNSTGTSANSFVNQTPNKRRRHSESNVPTVSEYGLSSSNWKYIKNHKSNIIGNVANNATKRQFNNYTKKITNLYMLNKQIYNDRNSKPLTTNNTEFTLEKFARGIRQKVRHLNQYKINASNYTVKTIYEKIGKLFTSLDTVSIDFKQIKGSINKKYHQNLEAMIKSVPINKVSGKYNIDILLDKLTDKSITTHYDELRKMVFGMIKRRSVENGENVVHDKNMLSKNDIKPNIYTLSKNLKSLKQKLSDKIMVYKEFGEQLPVKLHEVLFQKIDTAINQVETIKKML